jgi:hypothetical protein
MGRIIKVKCPYCGGICQGDIKEAIDDWLPADPVESSNLSKKKRKKRGE